MASEGEKKKSDRANSMSDKKTHKTEPPGSSFEWFAGKVNYDLLRDLVRLESESSDPEGLKSR